MAPQLRGRPARAVRQQLRQGGHQARPNVFGKDFLGHEAAHSDQWQHYSSVADFGAAYAAEQVNSFILCPDGGVGACNKFEIGANPFQGGYWDPPQVVNGVFARVTPGRLESAR